MQTNWASALLLLCAAGCEHRGDGSFDLNSRPAAIGAANVVSLSIVIPTSTLPLQGVFLLGTDPPTAIAGIGTLRLPELSPKAGRDSACEHGSSTFESGSRAYIFDLFDAQPRAVDYFRVQDKHCSFVDPVRDGTHTYDGTIDVGHGPEGFGYELFGSAGAPAHTQYASRNGTRNTTDSQHGRLQYRETNGLVDIRVAASFQRSERLAARRHSVSATLGDERWPLTVTLDADRRISLSGPVTFRSTVCSSGRLMISTLESLIYSAADRTIVGGRISVASDSNSATFDYMADGSILFHTSDGVRGLLRPEELKKQSC